MWQHFVLATSIVLGCAWFSFGQQVAYTGDSIDTIKEKVESMDAILLDVREHAEWNAGHVKQAVLLPMSVAKDRAQCAEALGKLDKSKPIYCHCKMGGRAMVFAEMVQGMGYDVRPMKQRFTQIADCGLEIVAEAE